MPGSGLPSAGVTEEKVLLTIREGEPFPAKHGRTGFRRNFVYNGLWRGHTYAIKQVEAIAVAENGWLVITVVVKFF